MSDKRKAILALSSIPAMWVVFFVAAVVVWASQQPPTGSDLLSLFLYRPKPFPWIVLLQAIPYAVPAGVALGLAVMNYLRSAFGVAVAGCVVGVLIVFVGVWSIPVIGSVALIGLAAHWLRSEMMMIRFRQM